MFLLVRSCGFSYVFACLRLLSDVGKKRYISSICTKSVEPRFFYYVAPTSIRYWLHSIDEELFNIVFLFSLHYKFYTNSRWEVGIKTPINNCS